MMADLPDWLHWDRARRLAWAILAWLVGAIATAHNAGARDASSVAWPNEAKTATIGDSTLSVHVSSRVAGAIDELVWRGKQFVNSSDHGREIQAAAAFSAGHRECFNPTEGGSEPDGTGQTSTSNLTSLEVGRKRLTTEVRMAYWLPPQDKRHCGFPESPKDGPLSNDIFRKTVTIGAFGMPNVVRYESTFVLPSERRLGGFEAPTGYMPADFSEFWIYDPATDQLENVPGELNYQTNPIIFSTPDKRYAMGIYAPPQSIKAIYSGIRFTYPSMSSPTVKWNVFFREDAVVAGEHHFDAYMAVGSLVEVCNSVRSLAGEFNLDRSR